MNTHSAVQDLKAAPSTSSFVPTGTTRAARSDDPLVPTLFHNAWWLDLATRGQFQILETKRDGRVVGRLPLWTTRRFGRSISAMPPITHFLGPAVDDGAGGANTRFLQRLTLTQELLNQLPNFAYFKQKMHRGVADLLPFQLAGFSSSVQFTHEIAPQPEQFIWQGLRDKTRNMVRKADRTMRCETMDDADTFIAFYRENLLSRNTPCLIDIPACRDLVAACLARGCGRIYGARHLDGRLASAIFCAWDTSSAYYLLSTRTTGSGNAATTLALWHAIKDVTSRGLIFDFSGLGSAGAVLFYSGFGATVQPRFIATRSSKWTQMMLGARSLLGYDRSPFF